MPGNAEDVHPLLRRPLYLYDLPPELLFSLTLRPDDQRRSTDVEQTPVSSHTDTRESPDGISTSTSCGLCQAIYPTVQDQREHVRSDLHRYNLRLQLKGAQPVNEATFTKLLGDLDESISGSDSSESEGDDEVGGARDGDITLTALLKRQAKLSQKSEQDDFSVSKRKHSAGNAPLLWVSSSKLPENTALGFYRALLKDIEQEEASKHLVDIIKQKQLKPIPAKSSGSAQENGRLSTTPHAFLCMIGGGHFAAMVVSLAPEIRKGQGGVEERHAIVLAHKTFHRYTTRRKQGGSQSANDNAKGNAHSAGSSIRRYNEAALEADVRSVLSDWKSMIDNTELLFIRATGSTNRRTLFGPYEGQVLRSNDKRIRGFPFSTRRATQAELIRSFAELTRLKVCILTEAALETTSADKDQAPSSPDKSSPKPSTPNLSKEEEGALHTSQILALIRRSKAPALLLYLTKNHLSPNYPFHPPTQHRHAPTPLHLAASTNSPALVLALLTKAQADPTLANTDGKAPFDVAGDARTRDAFRVARHTLGEDAGVDWSAAHIPSPLSQEEADARSRREKATADAAEAERRKADLDKIRKGEEDARLGRIQKKAGAGRTMAASGEKTAEERREEESRGLTPEMRMRLERERRARAAEERIRRMQAGR